MYRTSSPTLTPVVLQFYAYILYEELFVAVD